MRTLVLGGIRSGKSRWAEEAIATSLLPGQPVRYLASGRSYQADTDWSQRIAKHRDRRPTHWSTVETQDLTTELRQSPDTPTLVDDLGAWLTGTLDRHQAWEDGSIATPVEAMIGAVGAFEATLVLVSPEVGLTVVPATASGRRFADELGSLNQRVAALCERVVLVVAGQPVSIKSPGT
ncbi:bifunctional adenosylcobinamide kinase/adenosylcobinamide-phosphate guanylyltransferase [Mycobacterium montefiorense]|uniref:Adenosylcobinamide kinase n=1 Tax=Mycobacterium montefiorense TaxID=154654 RepID=A0AA37PN38_9MYCO|nr:bifunctional adenosylcobinamide kinase/adenosylcobinamide-phosphate guanylyltransferase [Mycobacterium montefiorense]MCV7425341.1 bifunctional adenosylcobinamide kinase/adenosylcobinamide-phosphate guanylyltransferase [Mycobacterium montefiorense]GBG37218.1 adenosylcobinamide kinase [Mycobacterium montefiorense]GKU36215.1 adenosylcobinamide kinase [Mycobacterium montefiorense]GKU39638.1 adenosylcobinamide kinase [Mycobacterium montefiorense]GKU46871.1 adenosylcobinamide kinase [Mycobacteriu